MNMVISNLFLCSKKKTDIQGLAKTMLQCYNATIGNAGIAFNFANFKLFKLILKYGYNQS